MNWRKDRGTDKFIEISISFMVNCKTPKYLVDRTMSCLETTENNLWVFEYTRPIYSFEKYFLL